jgi:DNA-binding response OmpR family regulator
MTCDLDPSLAPDLLDPAANEKLAELRGLLARAQQLLTELLPSDGPAERLDQASPSSRRGVEEKAPLLEEAYRRARLGNGYVDLRKYEMALLRVLMDADRPVAASEILEAMYPQGPKPEVKIIAVYLSHLRKKLRPLCGGRDPIQTIRGQEFKLHLDMLMTAEVAGGATAH